MGIRLNDISKSYNGRKVIEHFTLEFPDRGITVLMAPSGAGKTTLLRIIAGLEKPDSGTVDFQGDRVAVVFQEARLFPWLTAAENITAAAGVSRERAAALLEEFHMGTELDLYPAELSGGMQRRVALARAFAYGGALLLDEPFNGLDEELVREIMGKIKAYAKSQPVLLVTHNQEEARLTEGTVLHLEKLIRSEVANKNF